MDKKDILQVFEKYGTDKGWQHGYHQMYADVFNKIPAVSRLLEVGVKKGRSLAAWKELFPDAEIVGGEKFPIEVIPEASGIRVVVDSSLKPTFAEEVGTGFDVIIDDGNHHVDMQWGTFLNLQNCWNHAYVIEDIEGQEAMQKTRVRLKTLGYRNFVVYSSKLSNAVREGTEFAYYSIVVYPAE